MNRTVLRSVAIKAKRHGIILTTSLFLFSINWIQAQGMTTKPTFKYRADNVTDTSRTFKVAPNKEKRAVSVCAVWNLTDTAERTLWRMADSTRKVAAEDTII